MFALPRIAVCGFLEQAALDCYDGSWNKEQPFVMMCLLNIEETQLLGCLTKRHMVTTDTHDASQTDIALTISP